MKSKLKNSKVRHICKTITWRILGTLDTIFLSYLLTGSMEVGLKIGVIELFSKMFLYYIHERIWYKSDIGLERGNKDELL